MASVITAPRLQKHEGTQKFGHRNNRSQYGNSFSPNTLISRQLHVFMFMDNRWITAHTQVLLRGRSTVQESLNNASSSGKLISVTVARTYIHVS